jgi:hypothetical protein
LPADARDSALDGNTVTTMHPVDGQDYLWAATPIRVGSHQAVISVRQSTAESEQLLAGIDRAVLLGMVGAALVVGGIASFAAGQISRRLTLGAQATRACGCRTSSTTAATRSRTSRRPSTSPSSG